MEFYPRKSIFSAILKATIIILSVAALILPLQAKPYRMNGVTFSEGSSNMEVVNVSGEGTLNEPYVVVERIFGEGEAVLAIDVWSQNFGSRIATVHATGFAIKKVVINDTNRLWDYFGLELEFLHGLGSDYYDGLSFAQSATANRPFRSNLFKTVEDLVEPRDIIRFTDGKLKPGGRASFTFSVTYTGHTPKFLIVQHVRRPYAGGRKPEWYAKIMHDN